MPKGRGWSYSEEKLLSENYASKTIKELLELLPGRSAPSINTKIRHMKNEKKINHNRDEDARRRAYFQR